MIKLFTPVLSRYLLITVSIFSFVKSNAQWQQTAGPYGSTIYSFAQIASNTFVGTTNGVFVSSSNGASWTRANFGISNKVIKAMAVNGASLYAASEKDGIFVSANNGTSWTSLNVGLSNTNVRSLVFNGSNFFAGTEGGVFISVNNGSSWTNVSNGLVDKRISSLTIKGSSIFAGTDSNGVFISTNNGTSWSAINNGLNDTIIRSLLVVGSKLFVGTNAGVYVSTNNGNLWTFAGGPAPEVFSLASVPSDTNTIYASSDIGVIVSINNGLNWNIPVSSGISSKEILSVFINGSNVFAGTNGDGVYISSNQGSNWTASNTGLSNTVIQSLILNGNNVYAGTHSSGFYATSNKGVSWVGENNGLIGAYVNSIISNGTDLLVGTDLGMYKSTNNASSWSLINTGLTSSYVNCNVINGSKIYAGTSNGIFSSTNNGSSWSVGGGLSYPYIVVKAMVVNGSNVFAGAEDSFGTGGGIYISSNNGTSWSLVNTGLTNKKIYSLVVKGTTIYAGTAGGVFVSTNNGTNWNALSSGLVSTNVYAMYVSSTGVYAGTDDGVYLLNGAKWFNVSGGLSANVPISTFAADSVNLYAGTLGAGVWKRPLSEIAACDAASCLVWPGDVDNDNVVNNYDLLPVSVYFGRTGYSRDSTSNSWWGHPALKWEVNQYSGQDLKFADCNGDGEVNEIDTAAIQVNFSKSHSKTENILSSSATDASLAFVTTYSVYGINAIIDVDIWLGNSALSANKIYGLAFDVNYSSSLVQSGVTLSYNSTSFIKSGSTKTVSINKVDEVNGVVYGAIARTTHTTASGAGKIATIRVKTKNGLSSASSLQFSFTKYKAIDSVGNEITLNPLTYSVNIDPFVGIAESNIEEDAILSVFPNPNNGKFVLKMESLYGNSQIVIYDILGNLVYSKKVVGEREEVDFSSQSKGFYFIKLITSAKTVVTKRVLIQ